MALSLACSRQGMLALPRADLPATVKVDLPGEVLFMHASFIATVSIYERYGPEPRTPTIVSQGAFDLIFHVRRS